MSMGHFCSRCEDYEQAITANDEEMQRMAAKNAELVEALAEREAECVDLRKKAADWSDRALILETQNAELVAALKPFAKEANSWSDRAPDDLHPSISTFDFGDYAEFTVGDFRRARAALAAGRPQGSG